MGVKLGIYCVQGVIIGKKTVRKSQRDGEGEIKYDGEIIRKKGDAYMVDFIVTGADSRTYNAPNLSLKSMFEEYIVGAQLLSYYINCPMFGFQSHLLPVLF